MSATEPGPANSRRPGDQPERSVLSPNEVVAYNLGRARRLRGWTQDEAAEHLERHLGVRWSKVVFSAAERSMDKKRGRRFDADEIVAFARTFGLPPLWFFLPPGGDADQGGGALPLTSSVKPLDVEDTMTPDELLMLELCTSQAKVVTEIFDRADTYEPGVNAGLARGLAVDHLVEWGRSLVTDSLTRNPGQLRSIRNSVQRLLGLVDAAIAAVEQED